MAKVISISSNIRKSVKWRELENNAESISFDSLNGIDWKQIRELHILGNTVNEDDCSHSIEEEIPSNKNGGYLGVDKNWLLILGAPLNRINDYISFCSDNLVVLDVRFTDISSINLANVKKIEKLHLQKNPRLEKIIGLSKLLNLRVLDLKDTLLNGILDLSFCPKLYSISLRRTQIQEINLNCIMQELKFLDIAYTPIDSVGFLEYLPSVERINLAGTYVSEIKSLRQCARLKALNISNTKISDLPDVSGMEKLNSINIAYTLIDTLNEIVFPPSMQDIILSGTKIKVLPDNIGRLKNIRRLSLANMQLEMLPTWLNKLKLEFVFDEKLYRGINLYNTQIKNVDMDIFNRPRSVIDLWFRSKEILELSEPTLNESKVIFLGDGGSGKSMTIQRILLDGENVSDFSGDATPGISITTKEFIIDNKTIQVHFWDFGGQEILHSMHRMFLTKRTLYVVLVNARDNTQDERARYWLHNIKSFANGSPVLLVLNQIDQNPSASVNEVSLRNLYPQLTQIVKLSAKEYSPAEFLNSFESVLCESISKMPSIAEPFLPSWRLLKARLQSMSENYIYFDKYSQLCEECGVDKNAEVRNGLLEWFSDLGVSFCYRDNSALSEFMVLRPDWITNAIYLILFNSSGRVENGMIKHTAIHELLHSEEGLKNHFKSVYPDMTYSHIETEYVLGVIRKFRLSYRIDDETEFIPMLCERNEKLSASLFLQNSRVLEFHMDYQYLPNNVFHRLMVEMRSHLDFSNVWLTGAVFEQKEMGLRALVKGEDNTLKIYATSLNPLHPANTYLSIIKSTILRINEELGLEASEKIVYRAEEKEEIFDYNYLIESLEHQNQVVYSSQFKRNLRIMDILKQTDRGVIEKEKELIESILDACRTLQSNKIYWDATEDERNTYIRDILRAKGYIIADQTFSGKSFSGKKPGELDISIMKSTDKAWTVIEALNISGFASAQKNKWNEHLLRLLDNYNPIGYPFLFLISYLECSKDRLNEILLDYAEHLSRYSPLNYELQKFSNRNSGSAFIWSGECVYDRAGFPTTVYHVCVRLGK